MELSVVLQCIKKLLSPPREGTSLLHSLAEALENYKIFTEDKELNKAVESAICNLEIPRHEELAEEVSIYSKFTEQGLALLCLLDEALRQAHTHDLHSSSQTKAPEALLSADEEKSIHTLLQFLVALGLFPYLQPGVDHLLRLQLGEIGKQINKSHTDNNPSTNSTILYIHCRPLLRLLTTPVIGASVVSRHLATILACLLQVCHTFDKHLPSREGEGEKTADLSSEEERTRSSLPTIVGSKQCEAELRGLLDRLNQPLVVRELLRLQGSQRSVRGDRGGQGSQRSVRGERGAPTWLRRDCGRLLSNLLMKEDGVLSVLRGIFDVTSSGDEGVESGSHGNWKRVQAVAQIISHCPAQVSSPSHYYSIISPQLLKLLSLPETLGVQVATATVSLMLKQQPSLCRSHFLHPLTLPLRHAASGEFVGGSVPSSPGDVGDIETAIGNLHRVCGCVEPSSLLLQELQPFLPVIFKVWQEIKQIKTLSQKLKSEIESVLVAVVHSLDSVGRIQFLICVAGLPRSSHSLVADWVPVSPEVCIEESTEEGGGVCVVRGRRGEEEEEEWSSERMEREGRAILSLLGTLLKSGQLTAQFFTECLVCVASILCLDSRYQPHHPTVKSEMKAWSSMMGNDSRKSKSSSASSVLLDIERGSGELSQAESYRRSLALYLAAAISEESNSDILTNTDHRTLLEILGVVIECHAHIITRKNENSPSSPLNLLVVQPDLEDILGGSITLSIAFGYLSAILTGAHQMKKEDRCLLSSLPLETISTGYPDPELARLAEDLRICISTLGAVWSEEMKEWGEGRKRGTSGSRVLSELQRERKENAEPRPRSGDEREKKERKLIEEIHQTPTTSPSEKKENELKYQNPETKSKPHISEEKHSVMRFQEALTESEHTEVPVRGHGLSDLAKLIESSDGESLAHSDQLLEVFRDALNHSDTYVYLPAIRGLVALGSKQPERVLSVLCGEYAMFSRSGTLREQRVDKETGRLKTSEGSRTRRGEREGNGKKKGVSLELRLKLGEALVRVSRDCGELLPHHADSLMPAVLCNIRDTHPLVRASALSNLADICQLLGHSFTRYHHEVLSCVTHLLKNDDETPQVHQSSLLVLTLLLKGLSRQSVEVLGGDSLRDVYRLLKTVEGERWRDELTRGHARAALAQLDHIMREWIFSKPSLTKHITIL